VDTQGGKLFRQLAISTSLFLLLYVGLHSRLQPKEQSYDGGNELAEGWNTDKTVEDIRRLGNPGVSKRGKDFRSLICCLTRNDMHLREFVVRNLLAGFGHIVIYDNNQVESGIDYDVREMLAPFVAQGAVTLVPWHQNGTGMHLSNEAKNGNSRDCVDTYGARADWVAIMDTDEVFYLQHDPAAQDDIQHSSSSSSSISGSAIGILPRFLNDLERRSPTVCGISFPWRMMYGEHRFLKPRALLLDAYRRVCKIHAATKLLFRPEWSHLHGLPHGMFCTNPDGAQYGSDDGTFRQMMSEYTQHSHLVHYYQKSTEEWLVKMEQSIPPYNRYIPDSYDHVKFCPAGLTEMPYLPEYEKVVRTALERLHRSQDQGDGGLFLGPLRESSRQEYAEADKDFALYLYFKLKVIQRQDWDEERFLENLPEVRKAVEEQKYVDGLQYFVEQGFAGNATGAWVPENCDANPSMDNTKLSPSFAPISFDHGIK
jgi:hypothetical protein